MPDDDMTLGEVGRRLDRIELKIDLLSDNPTRLAALERRVDTAEARKWQVWLALGLAFLGVPLSILGSLIVALFRSTGS